MQGRSGFFVSVKSERVLLAGCGIVGWLLWAVAQEPTVTDGDTIKMAGTTYHLWRIDAPETHQACADGWAAGRISTEYLVNPMHGHVITCEPRTKDRYGSPCLRVPAAQ
jgi:endonuclease YncB( thermonuclease family)